MVKRAIATFFLSDTSFFDIFITGVVASNAEYAGEETAHAIAIGIKASFFMILPWFL
ncbi:hypothetical protein GCM10007086_38490 [Photobacterium aphoticum]|nr:hypothetical protein GCM10007086_38490 [Photobacterium aphoticum]